MGGSAGVGACSSPRPSSRTYHIIQYIYILYTDFLGFIWFVCGVFMGFFLLITSIAGAWSWRPLHVFISILYPLTLLQHVPCYIHGWGWWYDGWNNEWFRLFWNKLAPINTWVFCWKINRWFLWSVMILGRFDCSVLNSALSSGSGVGSHLDIKRFSWSLNVCMQFHVYRLNSTSRGTKGIASLRPGP